MPLLRRRLPGDAACGQRCERRQAGRRRKDPLRDRPRWPGQPGAALRQGTLRLRLRAPRRTPRGAVGASSRCRERPARHRPGFARRTRVVGPVPRSHVGRSAGPCGRRLRTHSRHRGAERNRPQRAAGRLRIGEGQQRRGVPVPEAGAHGLSHQQRRPLHPAVPCVVGGRAARRHRLGCGQQPGAGRAARRGRAVDRRQPVEQPSGGRQLHQERGQARHEAHRCRPTRDAADASREVAPGVQARHRRCAAVRDAAT